MTLMQKVREVALVEGRDQGALAMREHVLLLIKAGGSLTNLQRELEKFQCRDLLGMFGKPDIERRAKQHRRTP